MGNITRMGEWVIILGDSVNCFCVGILYDSDGNIPDKNNEHDLRRIINYELVLVFMPYLFSDD